MAQQRTLPVLTLRVSIGGGRLGRGKVELLENIAALGSIAAAGRAMGMSYRRAWELVEQTNAMFGRPAVTPQTGGKNGGGAKLTSLGERIITEFRAVELAAVAAARDHLAALDKEVSKAAPGREARAVSSSAADRPAPGRRGSRQGTPASGRRSSAGR